MDSHKVCLGRRSTKVWPVTVHGRSRWRYFPAGSKKPRTVPTLTEAKELARKALKEESEGCISWEALAPDSQRFIVALAKEAQGPEDFKAAIDWLRSQNTSRGD